MNLKPAEQWVDESRNPNVVVSPAMRDLEIERIRKIQADVLRWAADLIRRERADHPDSDLADMANCCADDLINEANQLDPKPTTV